jgi:HAD superfamily hydrolase (TIGR01484 family)
MTRPARIRLVATDVDGTLVAPGGAVPGENRAALREAAARGVAIALATVRVRRTALRIQDELGVPVHMVCQAGATVHAADGTLLREEAIPLDLAREVAAFADAQGFGVLATVAGEHRRGPGHENALPSDRPPQAEAPTNLSMVDVAPTRFMVTGARGVGLLMERFAGAPLRIVRHYRPDGSILDAAITAAGATKERGLGFLLAHLGLAPEAVLAIGDAESDAAMLRAAGVGVAGGDAHPAARDAADWIAPRAVECGVAAAVRRFTGGDGAAPGATRAR